MPRENCLTPRFCSQTRCVSINILSPRIFLAILCSPLQVPSQPQPQKVVDVCDIYYNWDPYTNLLPHYSGKNGYKIHSSAPYPHNRRNSHHRCPLCVELQNRICTLEVHRCILDLIYRKRLRLLSLSRLDEQVIFLAIMIFYAISTTFSPTLLTRSSKPSSRWKICMSKPQFSILLPRSRISSAI